jgi:hypothetical protein
MVGIAAADPADPCKATPKPLFCGPTNGFDKPPPQDGMNTLDPASKQQKFKDNAEDVGEYAALALAKCNAKKGLAEKNTCKSEVFQCKKKSAANAIKCLQLIN